MKDWSCAKMRGSFGILLMVFGFAAIHEADARKQDPQRTEPDYTMGEELSDPEQMKYAALGSIGAIGNIWAEAKGPGVATMIQIRSEAEGSPADGLLARCDVILGIGDGKFTTDARKELSAAITEAEKLENGGKLVLNVWHPETEMAPVTFAQEWVRNHAIKRGEPLDALTVKKPIKAETKQVTITLPILGAFSETAPWDCDKTQKLIDAAAQSIIEHDLFEAAKRKTAPDEKFWVAVPELRKDGHSAWLGALGLLATGEEQYLPIVKKYVRSLVDADKESDWRLGGSAPWFTSYHLILLAEYFLLTGDDYVLPTIHAFARELADGASDVGTYSHGIVARYEIDGVKVKYPSAYGAMNQCSITCALALTLARKCGVEDPGVDRVIRQAGRFYRWFVDKGAIPYGDHEPWMDHDNNGVNSQVAVLFDLLGDKEATDYFTRMTLASYKVRELGHTGHFFSWQWGALGAARGGEEAAQSFVRNTRWFTELERRPGGRSVYQPDLKNDHGKYRDWSTTGSRLLQHCLPRRKLYITGKGESCIEPITGKALQEVIAAAEFAPEACTIEELLMSLGSWSPVVRQQAAAELGKREDADVVKELIEMLDSPNRYARYGACIGLRYAGRGSEAAVDKMVGLLRKSDDMTLRFTICTALRQFRPNRDPTKIGLGKAVLKAGPALLLQAATYEPETDPLRKLHSALSATLFYGGNAQPYWGFYPNGKGADKIDSDLKVAVIQSLVRNPNGGTRSNVACLFNSLTAEEREQLWGDIYFASKYQAPSGSMFAGGVRGDGLAVMVDKGVEEGISVGIDWALRQEGWGNNFRKWRGVPLLLQYGKTLQAYVPVINEVLAGWIPPRSKNNQKSAEDFKAKLADALQKPGPELISIKPHIEKVDPIEFYTTELKKR